MPKPNFSFENFNDQIKNTYHGTTVLRDDEYLSKKVRFSFAKAEINGKFSLQNAFCDKEIAKNLLERIGEIEDMTWSDFQNLRREQGWSAEKRKDGNNYSSMKKEYPLFSSFGHIRIKTRNKNFRIFCARKEDLIYLIRFDIDGAVNH